MRQADFFQNNADPDKRGISHYRLGQNDLFLHQNFLPVELAEQCFQDLMARIPWQQPTIRIAGKRIKIPRKQVWFGDSPFVYTYSGEQFVARAWPEALNKIRRQIFERLGRHYNSALCNLYRNGHDSVAWHSDDEPELGASPEIASYSLGQARVFHFKSKQNPGERFKIHLPHNSLLIMASGVQENWFHQLPKSKQTMTPRINITFRNILTGHPD